MNNTLHSVADVAAILNLKSAKANGKTEWHGANPTGRGARKDGFILYAEGNAIDRSISEKYTSKEVANFAGIDPNQYAPVAEYRDRTGGDYSNGTMPQARTSSNGASNGTHQNGNSNGKTKQKRALFNWGAATKFDYTDEKGELLYQVGRLDFPDGSKEFRQRRPDGDGGWAYSLEGVQRVLFNLPDVRSAQKIVICEGEKAACLFNADLQAEGLYGPCVATTSPQGAGNFDKCDSTPLHGKLIPILPDNNKQGEGYRDDILKDIGAHATCKVVELPDRGEGGDYVDFRQAGHTLKQALEMIEAAPVWTPLESETPPKPAPDYEIYTFEDMARIPRQQWLIRGLLLEKITSVMSADSGGFKSFIALESALCIASGRPFHGHDVKQGAAVYVAAEGFHTLLDRATAWAQFHEVELPKNFYILRVPVNLANEETVRKFTNQIESLSPSIVILDTLSQCAAGLNENSNDEMARFVGGMMAVGRKIGAHTQVIHHNAKSTGAFRGAGAIKANVDAHISLDRPDDDDQNTVFIRCEKQRGKPFEPFALRGVEVELPYCDEYGDPITSLVFEQCGDMVTPKAEKHANASRADRTKQRLLEVFDQCAIDGARYGGVKVGFWKEAVEAAEPSICKETTFWTTRTKFEKDGVIEECGNHNGSPVYRRCSVTSITSTTSNRSYRSEVSKPTHSNFNNFNNPLGVEVVEVESEGDQQKKMKVSKKSNRAAESEPYGAASNDENEERF